MKKNLLPLIVVLLAIMAISSGCTLNTASGSAAQTQVSASQFVEDFYSGYAENPGWILHDEDWKNNPVLADEFVQQIQEVKDAGQLMFDPLVCAQDVPTEYTIEEPKMDGSQAIVHVDTNFSNHFDVYLSPSDDTWQIANIECLGQQ